MFTWGIVVFIGLWLILTDINPVRKAKLMGSPMFIHFLVIGSGLWIHGGSSNGAMAAIVSGVCSALYVKVQRHFYGFIKNGIWHPGQFRINDPRSKA